MNSETPALTRKIKRFAPLQIGKILGVMYAAMGLLFAPFFLAMAIFELAAPTGIATFVGVTLAIVTPLFYGAMGFLGGVVSAWLYNVTVRFTGGMEVEFE
jgi:hypothetical protein